MNKWEDFFEETHFYGAVGMHNLSAELSKEPRRNDVTAYHVLLTSPYFRVNRRKSFEMQDYDLLTARLSALAWRRYNGSIYLVTDEYGEAYFRKNHFDNIYCDILPILDPRNFGIDAKKYWASGKLQALVKLQAPCAIIDLDLIVWRPLDLFGCELAAAHTEHILEQFYPDLSFFVMSKHYEFPKEWNSAVEPLNTSFVYFRENGFKDYYTKESIRFMQYERDTPDDGVRCMVFAEQRILGMCAAARGIKPKTFLNYDDLLEKQNMITHIWSAKGLLKINRTVRERYMELAMKKIDQLMEELPK